MVILKRKTYKYAEESIAPLKQKKKFKFWHSKDNRRKFVIEFAQKHNIFQSHEWGNVTAKQVRIFLTTLINLAY